MPQGFGSDSPAPEGQADDALMPSVTLSAMKQVATPKSSTGRPSSKFASVDPEEIHTGLLKSVKAAVSNVFGHDNHEDEEAGVSEDGAEGAIARTGGSDDEGAVQASFNARKQSAAPKAEGRSKRKQDEALEVGSDDDTEDPEPKKQKGGAKKGAAKASARKPATKAATKGAPRTTKRIAKPISSDEDKDEAGPSPEKVNGVEEYEVEAIVNSRRNQKTLPKLQYLVKWVGYEETTWESPKHMTHAKELVEKFHAANPKKPGPTNK